MDKFSPQKKEEELSKKNPKDEKMHTRAAYTDAYTGSREDDSKNSNDKYTKSSSPRLCS